MTEAAPPTAIDRASPHELVVARRVAAPVAAVFTAVFTAWATPELFRQWWVPASVGGTIVAFEADIRTGGQYRLLMAHPSHPEPMAFLGRYVEVVRDARIVWTNEEAGEAGQVTTVTFTPVGDATEIVLLERYPSAQALDEALESGATGGWGEQFAQLEAFASAPPPGV